MHATTDAHDTDDWLGVEAMLSVPHAAGPWSAGPAVELDATAADRGFPGTHAAPPPSACGRSGADPDRLDAQG